MVFFENLTDNYHNRIINQFKIGIFGSFEPRNKVVLIEIRDYLNGIGFDAKLSEDLQDMNPKNKKETANKYNIRMSDLLLKFSNLHIFFFFLELESEHNINQSASMELTKLHSQKYEGKVIILLQKGCINQQRAYFMGFMEVTPSSYIWETFHDKFNLKTYLKQQILAISQEPL